MSARANGEPAFREEREAALRRAAAGGDVAAVQALLEAGTDLNAAGPRDWTPLLRAAERGHRSVARRLIERGADVNAADRRGRTAILWTARRGDVELARELIARGAAATLEDANGNTPLREAVAHGRAGMVSLLLDTGPWSPRTRDYYWRGALALGIRHGRVRILEAFLDHGLDVNHVGWILVNGRAQLTTLLVQAAAAGQEPIVRLLLERGAHPHYRNEERRSAMSEALTGGHSGVVRLLLAAGATIGLEEAVVTGDAELADRLLAAGADVVMPDRDDRTLLFAAIQAHQPDVVRLLLRYGADVTSSDRFGKTPLMAAAAAGDLALIRMLAATGADPCAATPYGHTPLIDAAGGGHEEAVRWLLERCGLGPDAGAAALVFASIRGHGEVVRLLLDAGVTADAHTRLHHDATALMEAAYGRYLDLVSRLGAAAGPRRRRCDAHFRIRFRRVTRTNCPALAGERPGGPSAPRRRPSRLPGSNPPASCRGGRPRPTLVANLGTVFAGRGGPWMAAEAGCGEWRGCPLRDRERDEDVRSYCGPAAW